MSVSISIDSPNPCSNTRWLSGLQRYRQRLLLLEIGKAYTTQPSDVLWERVKHTQGNPPTAAQWKDLFTQESRAITKGQGANRLSVLIGDSITYAFPNELLPKGQLWLNQGVSGENTGLILNRLSALTGTRPTTLYLLAGINDLRQNLGNAALLANYRKIIQTLRKNYPSAQCVIQSILPTNPTIQGCSLPSTVHIRQINQQLEVLAKTEGARYINLFDRFTDSESLLRRELTTDGLHLSNAGYNVWQQLLKSQVE